jgi:hypothetical protein
MIWSSERPSVPGYYWLEGGGLSWARIVSVWEVDDGGVLRVSEPERTLLVRELRDYPDSCRWAGPLVPPSEPRGEESQ